MMYAYAIAAGRRSCWHCRGPIAARKNTAAARSPRAVRTRPVRGVQSKRNF